MTQTGESLEQILARLKNYNDELQNAVVDTAKKTNVNPDLGSVIDQIVKTQQLPIVQKKSFSGVGTKFLLAIAALGGLFASKDIVKPYVPVLSTTIEVVQNKVSDLASTVKPEEKITVAEVKNDVVVLNIEKGKQEIRTGGSVSWRYNNPGLMFSGSFSKEMGEIGSDGKYAIFKNYIDGRAALEKLLFESNQGYKDKTVEDALKLYAPKNEGFNTDFYIATVRKESGIPLTKVMSEFNIEERKTFLETLEKIERFKVGNIEIK